MTSLGRPLPVQPPLTSTLRLVLAALLLGACGAASTSAAEPVATGTGSSEASALPGSENGVRPPPGELPGLGIDASRPLASLDAAERHALADWLRVTVPRREADCPDGHRAHMGYRPDVSDDEVLPPAASDDPPECRVLSVMDLAGCQLVGTSFEPCDSEHALRTWAPGGACEAVAGCLSAVIRAASGP